MPLNLAIGSARVPIQIGCEPPTYTPARWKGIPFHVESSNDEFGRRGDIYEYPLGEDTGYKDLGRRARRFKVEGYLIGTQQVALSRAMANAAESPEPGMLDHPLFGGQLVACITLSMTADYRRDKKRTKLAFEFVEAAPAMAPFAGGVTINLLWHAINNAIRASFQAGAAVWDASPTAGDLVMLNDIALKLASLIKPTDEDSYDAQDMLRRFSAQDTAPEATVAVRAALPTTSAVYAPAAKTFVSAAAPLDYGSATIARIHGDALLRLREFNGYVVTRQEATPTAQALILTTRLIVMRDYAVAAARKQYETIGAALDDLDFIMAVFDDEEELATQRCDDALVSLIYRSRATASAAILARNIRLPGISEWPVDGVWPSLVAAQKLYADGQRHQQIEAYNPTMLTFFMGRDVIAPTR